MENFFEKNEEGRKFYEKIFIGKIKDFSEGEKENKENDYCEFFILNENDLENEKIFVYKFEERKFFLKGKMKMNF